MSKWRQNFPYWVNCSLKVESGFPSVPSEKWCKRHQTFCTHQTGLIACYTSFFLSQKTLECVLKKSDKSSCLAALLSESKHQSNFKGKLDTLMQPASAGFIHLWYKHQYKSLSTLIKGHTRQAFVSWCISVSSHSTVIRYSTTYGKTTNSLFSVNLFIWKILKSWEYWTFFKIGGIQQITFLKTFNNYLYFCTNKQISAKAWNLTKTHLCQGQILTEIWLKQSVGETSLE